MFEAFDYIKECLISEKSPADEVLVIDGVICIRVDNVLLGVKIESIKISLNKPEKKPVKKAPKKKSKKKTPSKKKTVEKPSP